MNISADQVVYSGKPSPLLERIKRFGTKGLDFNKITISDMCQGEGTSSFHMFAKLGAIGELPEAWLTPKYIVEFQDSDGNAPIHVAAEWGKLNSVPSKLKNQITLSTLGKNEYTVFHYAAYASHLDSIPKPLITKENMLLKSKLGKTPLHGAAGGGQLDLVPSDLRTSEYLFLRDSFRETPFHLAAEYGHLDQIPIKLLTLQNLTARGFMRNSLGHAMNANQLAQIPIFKPEQVCLMSQEERNNWQVALNDVAIELKSNNAAAVLEVLSRDWSHLATHEWGSL